MSFSTTFRPRKPAQSGNSAGVSTSQRTPSTSASTMAQASTSSTGRPAPSRPAGTPLGLPSAPSRPAGTPLGVPLAPPSRPAGTPLGVPLAPPSRPAGTPLGAPAAPPSRPAGTALAPPSGPSRPTGQPLGTPAAPSSFGAHTSTAPTPAAALRQPPPAPPAPSSTPSTSAFTAPSTSTGSAAAISGSSTLPNGATRLSSPSARPRPPPPPPVTSSQPSTTVASAIQAREAQTPQVRSILPPPPPSSGEETSRPQDESPAAGKKRAAPATGGPAAKRARNTAPATTTEGEASASGTRRSARVAAQGPTSAPTYADDSHEEEEQEEDEEEPDQPARAARSKTRAKRQPTSASGPKKGKKRKLDFLRADANGLMPGEEGYDPVSGGSALVPTNTTTNGTLDSSAEGNTEEAGAASTALVLANKRPRRGRTRTATPELDIDPATHDPGPPLDASSTLMSDILRDPGVGRVSNRFVEAFRAKRRLNEERRRERVRRVEEERRKKRELEERAVRALELGERTKVLELEVERERAKVEAAAAAGEGEAGAQAEGGEGGEEGQDRPLTGLAAAEAALRAAAPPLDEEEDEDGPFRETHTAPQIRINASGDWEVDESALEIDRTADPALAPDSAYEVVEEREADRFVTSYTWSRREREGKAGQRWSKEETELLCRGVGWFGYDFEMISRLFVGRNRGTVKRRWKRLEREEPERARMAWENREPVDLSFFSKHVGANLLLPAAPIARPSTPAREEDPAPPNPDLSVQQQPATAPQQTSRRTGKSAAAGRLVDGEPEEEEFDMDVGEEEEDATYEEIDARDVVLGADGEEDEDLPSVREAMRV